MTGRLLRQSYDDYWVPIRRASYAENVFMSWRHLEKNWNGIIRGAGQGSDKSFNHAYHMLKTWPEGLRYIEWEAVGLCTMIE